MKKIFSFVLSLALLSNILCSTIALAETDFKVVQPLLKGKTTITYSITDPETVPE